MCSAFPDWEMFAVRQRRPNSGCIPTGYEMLIRAAGAEGIDLDSFQDDFDLDQNLKPGEQPKNNFDSVADAVREKYPKVIFKRICFDAGIEKLRFVEGRIRCRQPVLFSIALEPFGQQGWHIIPIVDATEENLILLNGVKPDGTKDTWSLSKDEFVRIHDEYDGGDDVAYLEGWK